MEDPSRQAYDEALENVRAELTELTDEEWDMFRFGFEEGYMAGIDRGMEVEYELEREQREQHNLIP